jgi:hypothetical protein
MYQIVPSNEKLASSGGIAVFKIYSYGRNKDMAVKKALIDAVHAVLFKGIPNSETNRPLIQKINKTSDDIKKNNRDYLIELFGDPAYIDNPMTWYTSKMDQGSYKDFVQLSTESQFSTDVSAINGGVKLGVYVSVNYRQLELNMREKIFNNKLY